MGPWSDAFDLPFLAIASAVVLSIVALVLLGVHHATSEVTPIYLSRRIFAAHLFACLFLELRKAFVWSDFSTWTLALHVLFFGLCERGQPWLTRILHGPSFGGSHAIFMGYLFMMLTERPGLDLWSLWLRTVPCILHWVDGLLNFQALVKAYSPPMGGSSLGPMASALYFAGCRMALRAWAAAVGYVVLERLWRGAMQTPGAAAWDWEWSFHILQVSEVKEVLPLASTIMAYTAFTHRLIVTPEDPEEKKA